MPRPGLPPTPGSSTEIRGKDQVGVIEDFSLPPAALPGGNVSSAQSGSRSGFEEANAQANASGGTKRKRRKPLLNSSMQSPPQISSAAESTFSLPPPPSRSRKIIQVQPEDAKGSLSKALTQSRKKSESGKGVAGASGGNSSGTAKPTAASRKTARKTAHSIIERRRRSKMNEEFETLKELVPAARGQSMHKLAILQAGIEYVRYLEDCIHGLKGAQSGVSGMKTVSYQALPDLRPSNGVNSGADEEDMDEDEEDESEEEDRDSEEAPLANTPRASRPASGYQSQSSVSNSPSPAICPLHTQYADSSYALSTGSPSPAMPPSFNNTFYPNTAASSTLPSPALLPSDSRAVAHSGLQSGQMTPIMAVGSDYHVLQAHARKALVSHGEADQEVIATLAMMGTERRRSQEERERTDGTRGMSVRDLLSG